MNIRPDQLAKTVVQELEKYQELTLEQLTEVTRQTAKETVTELKSTSPKRTGDYARSWTHKAVKDPETYAEIIHVKAPHYRLTHLLEFAHEKVLWGRRTGEQTNPAKTAHIKKAEEAAIEKMESRLIKEMKK